jgi:hypothetical protein
MHFPTAPYDTKLLKLMSRAYEDACRDVTRDNHPNAFGDAARTMMAIRIMTAVTAGERNLRRLKVLAVQAIDGRGVANDA